MKYTVEDIKRMQKDGTLHEHWLQLKKDSKDPELMAQYGGPPNWPLNHFMTAFNAFFHPHTLEVK